jgi:hypothetical protein
MRLPVTTATYSFCVGALLKALCLTTPPVSTLSTLAKLNVDVGPHGDKMIEVCGPCLECGTLFG